MEYDEVLRLHELNALNNKVTELHNEAIEEMTNTEIMLNVGIIDEDISDKLSTWKKQVIALMKKNRSFIDTYLKYMDATKKVKTAKATLKSIESEINCIKKHLTVLPIEIKEKQYG